MTKEITKAHIIQEIQDKLGLRELTPEKFAFSEQVIPVYNIEQHLVKYAVRHATMSITSAASFQFFVIPATERWTLRAYQIIYGMTGAHKGTGLFLKFRPGINDYIYLDMTKGQEISYLVNLPAPVVLEPSTVIYYNIDTYVSTQDLTIDIDVLTEDLR